MTTNNSSLHTVSCHLCKKSPSSMCSYKICGQRQCHKVYCIKCIKTNFPSLKVQNTTSDHDKQWVCYSCLHLCNCKRCLKNEIIIIESSQELIHKESHVSQNKDANHEHKKQSVKYFSQYKQDSHSPFQYSSQIHYSHQEKKSRGIAKSKKERSLMGLKSQHKKIPPYLASIIKRKEIFINFMQRHSKKSYEQLLKEETENNHKKIQGDRNPQQNITSPVMRNNSFNNISILDHFSSPSYVPQTPSFLPVSEPPLTPVMSKIKISDMLNEKLREYDVQDEDLSLQLM